MTNKIYAIALIKKHADVIGLRLFDTETKLVKDVELAEVIRVIELGVTVENIDIKNNAIDMDDRNILRMATLMYKDGKVYQSEYACKAYTVIAELVHFKKTIGYEVVDPNGKVIEIKYDRALELGSTYGLSNAETIEKDGKQIIIGVNCEIERKIVGFI